MLPPLSPVPPPPPPPLPSPPQSFLPQLPSPPLPEPLVTSESGDESIYSDDELDSLPSVKKQKLNEEDAESSELESSEGYSSEYDTEGELFRPFFPGQILGDKACWKRYFEQIHDSEGFDIKDYPGSGPMTTIVPMPNYVKNPKKIEMMKGFAAQALEQYNEKRGTTYEVNEILKVNGRVIQNLMYYITLSVKNGENEYFQVKVVKHRDSSLDFPIVRPRVKGGLDI